MWLIVLIILNHLNNFIQKDYNQDYIKKIAPYTVHLHISDSHGTDGEGIQVGEGEIDFASTFKFLDKHCPKVSFIPEIWQGHKNFGSGFWYALNKLENF